jgi:hypothetical protein
MYNAPVKNGATFTDLTALNIINLHTGTTSVTTANLLNGDDGEFDFNSFNSNMVVFPVKPSQIGLSPSNASFNYEIVTFDRFGLGPAIDDEGPFFYDAANPGLSFSSPDASYDVTVPFYDDQPGVVLTTTINTVNYATNGTKGALLLHYHNTTGKHAEVVSVVTDNACTPNDNTTVTKATDDGTGTVCGTLSYVLKVNSPNGGGQIDFSLGTGNTINLTSSGPVTMTVPVNTQLLGATGICDQANNIVLNNTSGYPIVLQLIGGVSVEGLTLNGVKLYASKPSTPLTLPNTFKCTVVKGNIGV